MGISPWAVCCSIRPSTMLRALRLSKGNPKSAIRNRKVPRWEQPQACR
jgi:hypothetical protein